MELVDHIFLDAILIFILSFKGKLSLLQRFCTCYISNIWISSYLIWYGLLGLSIKNTKLKIAAKKLVNVEKGIS